MEISRSEMSELTDISWHWETAYVVTLTGVFTASRMNDPEHIITAASPAELRHKIREDYYLWQQEPK